MAGLPAAPRIFASASIDQSVGPPLPSQIFVERVLAIINAHDPSTPLFLFWAPHIVHAPLEVPQAYLDKFAWIEDGPRESRAVSLQRASHRRWSLA